MNKLGIFMNFWEKNWDADHEKYIRKVADIGFDILEFQAQPLLEMSDDKLRHLKRVADECGVELTYSLGLDPRYDVSSALWTERSYPVSAMPAGVRPIILWMTRRHSRSAARPACVKL